MNRRKGEGVTWLRTKEGTMQGRKPWRRRLIWEHKDDPSNHTCYAIILLPPPKPIHHRMTVMRKTWSKSVRQYITFGGDVLTGDFGRFYSPYAAFKHGKR